MAKRRNFSAQFKAKVALEALRGERTLRWTPSVGPLGGNKNCGVHL